jgi:hypothetical protein
LVYFFLSGKIFCNELITRPEESYRMWSAVVCDIQTSLMSRHSTNRVNVKPNKEEK